MTANNKTCLELSRLSVLSQSCLRKLPSQEKDVRKKSKPLEWILWKGKQAVLRSQNKVEGSQPDAL